MCKYCDRIYNNIELLSNNEDITVEIDTDGLCVYARIGSRTLQDTNKPQTGSVEININFCPMCGKKLKKWSG